MIWLGAAIVAMAQAADTVEVDFVVRERGSGLPVQATVRSGELSRETDELGQITLDIPPGKYRFEIVSPDHQLTSVIVEAPAKRPVRLFLEPLGEAELVIVEGERPRDAGTVIRTQQQLRETPGAFGDPVRAMEIAPSVASSRFGDEGIIVRGSEPTTTAVRIDGIDVPWLYHWYFLRSVVDPSMIEGLTLQPSGAPVSQGGFAQGLLTVDLKDEVTHPGFHGRASFDLLDFSVAGSARLSPKWHLFLGGRVSWGGELGGAIAWLASGREVYVPVRWNDAHLRLVGDLGDHQVSATFFGALDSLKAFGTDGPLANPSDTELPFDPARIIAHRFGRAQVAWSTETERFTQRTALQLGRDFDASVVDGIFSGAGNIGLIGGPTFGRLGATRLGFRHGHRIALTDLLTLDDGVDADVVFAKDEHYARLNDAGEPTAQRQTLGLVSPWTSFDLDTQRVRVEAGFRGSLHLRNGESTFVPEPRVGLTVRSSDLLTLTADVGAQSQRPPVWMSSESFGVGELSPVFSWQSSVGAIWKPHHSLTLSPTIYAGWYPSLLVEDIAVQALLTPDDAPRYTLDEYPVYRDVQGVSAGFELQAAWHHRDMVELGASLALGRSVRIDRDETWAAARDQPVQATVWGALRPTPEWSFSARAQVAQGPPWRDPHLPLGTGETIREPWVGQLDLRGSRTFVSNRARWTLYADVFNVTGSKLPLLTAIPPQGTRPEAAIYLGVIPNVGLEVTF